MLYYTLSDWQKGAVSGDEEKGGSENGEPEEGPDGDTYCCAVIRAGRPVCEVGGPACGDYRTGEGDFFIPVFAVSAENKKGICAPSGGQGLSADDYRRNCTGRTLDDLYAVDPVFHGSHWHTDIFHVSIVCHFSGAGAFP